MQVPNEKNIVFYLFKFAILFDLIVFKTILIPTEIIEEAN